MKTMKKWLPLMAAMAIGGVALAGSPKMTCTLTGKEVKTCCCEPAEERKALLQAGEEGSR
jgi:hypothetical protein